VQPVPTFSTWPLVFLIAAAQGLFMAFILYRWRQGDPFANRLLATLMLLFSVTMVEYVFYWTQYLYYWPHLTDLSAQFPFLFGPILFFYVRAIFEGRRFERSDAWHALPFVLAVFAMLPWYLQSGADKQAVILRQSPHPIPRVLISLITYGRLAHMAFYVFWNFRYLKHRPAVGRSLWWGRLLNLFFVGFLLSYTSYFVLVRLPGFNPLWDYQISLSMTAFIYLIAYAGYVQPAVFNGFGWSEASAVSKYKNSGLTPDASRSLLNKMNLLMEREKLYLEPDLSLEKLAKQLDTGKHHVSQVINEHLNVNFFEYINQLRISEACRLLAEKTKSDLHVIEVAYAVGYNNKVSFNSAFKKATGMTPTHYRKAHGRTDVSEKQRAATGQAEEAAGRESEAG
jgi:AraC-like DNA-binding protein